MRSVTFAMFAMTASPAFAQAAASVDEPSNLALAGIGLAGLIIGRQFAKKRANKDENSST